MGIDNPYPTYIDDLDASLPAATDPLSQADDHIRMIKTVLKQTFPSFDSSIYDVVYPVGCIYESTVATDPSTLFPGTNWSSFGQGKMLVGLDPNDDDFESTSDSGGSKTVTLTENQIPSHDHDDTFTTQSAGGHAHGHSLGTTTGGNHRHSYTKEVTHGGGVDGAKDGNSNFITGYTDYAGTHNHIITGAILSVGGHTHTINGSVSNAGGGQAHDNMPPYVVVYRWKRDS